MSNEAAAKNVAEARQRLIRQAVGSASSAAIIASAISLVEGETVGKEIIKLPVLVKADVAGSVEAVCAALNGLQKEDDGAVCKVDLVFSGVGDVTSSDVAMAAASKAKIVAFNVASAYSAMEEARASNVEIGYYDVVYNLLDEIDLAIKSIISPPPPGVLVGEGIVKQVFKLGRIGKIAGCEVLSGMLKMASKVRVLRGKRNIVYMGSFQSLKVVKDDAVEVPVGSECGLSFVGFEDFQEGDKIECFVTNSTN